MTNLQKPPTAGRRAAWIMVIIMSTIFVLALLAVVWGFVRQARIFMAARDGHATTTIVAPAPTDAAAVITLAPGSRILSASTDSGKLVLHVATPTGGEVEIIDLATGRRTGQVRTH